MKLCVFEKMSNKPARALVEGFRKKGERVSHVAAEAFARPEEPLPDLDLAVVVGLHFGRQRIKDHYEALGVPCLVVEQGHITQKTHSQVGLGKLNWLPRGNAPSDRRKALGVVPVAWNAASRECGYVLVLGQKPGDTQHTLGLNIARWAYELCKALRNQTDRKLVFRKHPMDQVTPLDAYRSMGYDTLHLDSERISFEESLHEAHSVVTHNSNGGLKAILKGIPVFCDSCAIYARIADCGGYNIEGWKGPSKRDFIREVNRISYAQWTEAELANGTMWEYMKGKLNHG